MFSSRWLRTGRRVINDGRGPDSSNPCRRALFQRRAAPHEYSLQIYDFVGALMVLVEQALQPANAAASDARFASFESTMKQRIVAKSMTSDNVAVASLQPASSRNSLLAASQDDSPNRRLPPGSSRRHRF